MPLSQRLPSALDFNAIRASSEELQILSAKLPSDAVKPLANEVVERLAAGFRPTEAAPMLVSPDVIEQLCEALISVDSGAGAHMISEVKADGASVADIYLLYLSAAAKRLGEKWVSNDLSFLEVTIGTSRILAIMRSMGHAIRANRGTTDRFAVFASVPDEEHTIGIAIASDLFRRAGWDIELLIGLEHEEIIEKIGGSDALVVGLTAHGTHSLGSLVRLIAAIRIVNPAVYILVSGPIVEVANDIVTLTGADGFAADVPAALEEATRLLTLAHT